MGAAEAKILFGDANPCGKLAETIPYKLSDNPSYLNFPGDGETVEYKEGILSATVIMIRRKCRCAIRSVMD